MSNARKVLIVEDDDLLASLLTAKLRLLGWNPESVGTMTGALLAIGQGVDLVLLDLRLPDSDADKTLRLIHRMKQLGARRVVVMTGQEVGRELRRCAMECGADSIFSKDAHEFKESMVREFEILPQSNPNDGVADKAE